MNRGQEPENGETIKLNGMRSKKDFVKLRKISKIERG
jgi:hypothetical protein